MKCKSWLLLSLLVIANTALARSGINKEKYVTFAFMQPEQIIVNDLPGPGVLAVYVNPKSFGVDSDPVMMTCGTATHGSIKVFPGETLYCSDEYNSVSVTLLKNDFKQGTSGIVTRYSFA